MTRSIRPFPVACALVVFLALTASRQTPAAEQVKPNPAQGWQVLFDGKSLDAWEARTSDGKPAPKDSWVVEDGVLTRKGPSYLWTKEQYGDFILDLEFKVGPGANSGILLRHTPEFAAGTPKYWWNGLIEIQLFDSYGKPTPDTHDCGALYDMIAPSKNVMRKAGQWNRITLTAKGSRITEVLNGEKILDVDLNDWKESGKNPDGTPNKYHKPMKDVLRRGFIILQEHPGEIGFRNIYVKPLE